MTGEKLTGLGLENRQNPLPEPFWSGSRQSSGDSGDAVFDDRPGVQPSLADERRPVDPVVALVAGLEPRRDPEVVVGVLAGALAGVGGAGRVVVLDHPVVPDV